MLVSGGADIREAGGNEATGATFLHASNLAAKKVQAAAGGFHRVVQAEQVGVAIRWFGDRVDGYKAGKPQCSNQLVM